MNRAFGTAIAVLMPALVVLGASPAAAQDSDGFAYVLRNDTTANGGSKIYGYRVDVTTGLSAIAGFPVATGGNASPQLMSEGIAIDRANRRLFALDPTSRTVSGFTISPTSGALTTLPFSPISLGAAPSGGETLQCLAVHPSGSPLIVASRFTDSFGTSNGRAYSFNVTATSATAASGSPLLTGADTNPLSCEFSRTGDYFYTGGWSGTRFAGLAVNADTGILTALSGSPFLSGGNATGAFATDDTGRLFGADIATTVRVYTTTAGVPSQASSAPSGLSTTWDGLLHPAGFYVVAASFGVANVGVFRISGSGAGTTLTAVAGSPFATGGTSPLSLALDRTGTLLFATHDSTRNLTTFRMNTSTGALTSLGTQPANTLGSTGDIGGIVFAPFGESNFLDLNGDGSGDAFLYNAATGAWRFEVTNPGTGFTETASTWDLGWQVFPANLNGDAYTDIFLYDPVRGLWVQARNNAGDGTFNYTVDTWDRNWQVYPADLDGNGITDVFVYNFVNGVWVKCFVDGSGGFSAYTVGQWDPGWRFTTADMNADGRDDFFLYKGVWVEAFSEPGTGTFTYPASGQWDLGWQIYPADLNGDGRTDLFVYNSAGVHVSAISRAGGDFDYPNVGQWDRGWGIVPGHLNGDARTDLFLYNEVTGVWVEAFSVGNGDFTYAVGQWDSGWTVRMSDFNADGLGDILVSNTGGVWVQLTNTGSGTFSQTNGTWGTGWTVFTR